MKVKRLSHIVNRLFWALVPPENVFVLGHHASCSAATQLTAEAALKDLDSIRS